MRRTTILNAAEVKRTLFREAEAFFYKYCRLRNLRRKQFATTHRINQWKTANRFRPPKV